MNAPRYRALLLVLAGDRTPPTLEAASLTRCGEWEIRERAVNELACLLSALDDGLREAGGRDYADRVASLPEL